MENQINTGNKNTRMFSILILGILFFGILGWYIFSVVYKTNQLGLNITPTKPPVSNDFACSKDGDCVIGIQATSCCSCPKAVNKKQIGTKDWEQYEFGKDYSSQQTKSCGGIVACEPCELPVQPMCAGGKCQFSNQKTGVFIQLPKTTYGHDESIVFTVTNNTQQNVYYFPETCASSLVQVFLILDGDSTLIQGEQKICMLAPSVETLLPNGSITSKIPEKTFSKMAPGTYKMKFEYSTEKRDRFVIGEHSTVDSETFTVVK